MLDYVRVINIRIIIIIIIIICVDIWSDRNFNNTEEQYIVLLILSCNR